MCFQCSVAISKIKNYAMISMEDKQEHNEKMKINVDIKRVRN